MLATVDVRRSIVLELSAGSVSMKSTVCNLAGMAVAVACCSMLINRPSVADEQPVVQEHQQVIVVEAKGDGDAAVITETLNAKLNEKLEGLPEALQQKLRAKLEAVKQIHAGAVRVDGKKLVVSARDKAAGDPTSDEPKHVVVTVVPSDEKPEATAVVRAHAIVVNDGEKTQTFTIKVDGDQVQVNGEPAKADAEEKQVKVFAVRVDANETQEDGKAIRWQFKGPEQKKIAAVKVAKAAPAHADVVKRLAKIENELKQIRKLLEEMRASEAK